MCAYAFLCDGLMKKAGESIKKETIIGYTCGRKVVRKGPRRGGEG